MYSFYQGHNVSKSGSLTTKNNYSSIGNQSLLSEPQIVTLQRDVDNYTRKLEQEKRRHFAINETYEIVLKQHREKKDELLKIKEIQHSTETKKLNAQVKNLENKTEKMISQANTALSENKGIQQQIDVLRKERTKYLEIQKKLQEEIDSINGKTDNFVGKSSQFTQRIQESKEEITQVKLKNELEKKDYIKKFDIVQSQILEEKTRQREQTRLYGKWDNLDGNSDTESILKRRLKKLINSNKEKDKVIHQYLKNLRIIDDAFTAIKHGSGITDIDEITNTFIKSEEQNYSLYTYVDILSQDIDNLEESNNILQKQCQEQEEFNKIREKLQAGTPYDEQQKQKYQNLINNKNDQVNEFQEKLNKIHPILEKSLIQLASQSTKQNSQQKLFDYKLGFELNDLNFEQYLSDLEEYVNILIEFKNSQNQDITQINHTLLIDEIPEKQPRQFKHFNVQLDDLHLSKEFSHMMGQIQNNQNPDVHQNLYNNEKYDTSKLSQLAQDILSKKKQPQQQQQ